MLRFIRWLIFSAVLLFMAAVWIKIVYTPVSVATLQFMPEMNLPQPPHWERGWPATFYRDDVASGQMYSWWLLIVDLGVALAALIVVGIWLYRRLNRPNPWSFSLRSLLLGTTLIAAVCGWWLRERYLYDREQSAIRQLLQAGVPMRGSQTDYCGPAWMLRLLAPRLTISAPVSRRAVASTAPPSPRATSKPLEDGIGIFQRVVIATSPAQLTSQEELKSFTKQLPALSCLRQIKLTPNSLSLNSEVLTPLGQCSALEFLDLSGTDVDERGLAAIVTLSKLRVFDLRMSPNVDDAAAEQLCKLQALEVLLLTGTQITDHGALRLLELHHLKRIALPFRISDEMAAKFTAKGITVE